MSTRRRFLESVLAMGAAPRPSLRFAVLSDVQFADKATAGRRDYRQSTSKLSAAVDLANAQLPAFSIHLGDLIDAGAENAAAIVPVYNRMPGRRYLVLGNHDFFGPRQDVLRQFHLKRSYYSFRLQHWQFIVLDGMELSVRGGWPEASSQSRLGAEMLAHLKQQGARNANDWNGAVGAPQRAWLQSTLRQAARRGDRSIVFCHFPTLAAASRPDHLLWDHQEVLKILEQEPSTVAYFCGHDHNGGYAVSQGIHHFTLPGLVENDVLSCLKIVDLSNNTLSLHSADGSGEQVLSLRAMR